MTLPWLFSSALVAAVLMLLATAAQPEVIRCLPPEVPTTELPKAVLSEYRTEIAAQFEAYFAAFSDYVACLDAERDRALTEAREAANTYSAFLNTTPIQKDLP